MDKTHRAYVVYVCGVPFGASDSKTVQKLLRLSVKLPRLEVRPDGAVASLTIEDTNKLCNQLVTKVEFADVICTECPEHGSEKPQDMSDLAKLFDIVLRDKPTGSQSHRPQ